MHLDRPVCFSLLCARPHRADALSDDARLTCLSVAHTGPKSRTERCKQTKIVSQAAHVTRDSDTTFNVKSQRSTCRGRGHIVAASRTACV